MAVSCIHFFRFPPYAHIDVRFNPISRTDFHRNIFDVIYDDEKPTTDLVKPHELAIFFAILAIGLIWSTDPSASLVRDQYDYLARAAFSLAPIAISVTTTTVQALFCINRFLNHGRRTVHEECWLLHGLNARIAQMVNTVNTQNSMSS